ncbi:MAG: bifunctional folylpolyglutamate synthase/dihydrofolate synthase [Spirochaetia bacterium]|nr:bifunctional folylpolyglutamate synthase/dihydrofolate synthase [Spirochaetia bacterium]
MGMHSSSDAFNYIESFTNLERNFTSAQAEYKLERMAYMLDSCGHPECSFKAVHIAGSKGKGSTAAIVSKVLAAQGCKTGLFTSPHLVSYKERITLAGEFFSDDVYVRNTGLIKEMLESGKLTGNLGQPTTFELLTLLAFLIFREQGCQWAVIETGMGGRLDATNLIVPEVSIITPIELEHCDVLGDTIEKIAFEKAGIIKPGVPVVVQHQKPEALAVLKDAALKRGCRFIYADDNAAVSDLKMGMEGSEFELSIDDAAYHVKTNLTGDFQCDNIASALLAINEILSGFDMHKTLKALEAVKLEGRLEIVGRKPPIVIDGSHTAYSIQRLLESCKAIFGAGGVLVFGSVKGKNYQAMLDMLLPCFDAVIISEPQGFKETDVEAVYEYAKALGAKFRADKAVALEIEPKKALELAIHKAAQLGNGKPVVVTGSFYLAGAVKRYI